MSNQAPGNSFNYVPPPVHEILDYDFRMGFAVKQLLSVTRLTRQDLAHTRIFDQFINGNAALRVEYDGSVLAFLHGFDMAGEEAEEGHAQIRGLVLNSVKAGVEGAFKDRGLPETPELRH